VSDVLCTLGDLESNGAKEVVRQAGKTRATIFVVQYEGRVHAYVNSCPHVRLPLNWSDDVFFDSTGRYIVCANHAARFDAATGQCVRGPCKGQSLTRVDIAVEGDTVVLRQPFPMS
jgi:nitrite reductase/ring-hydroxylating ferredoxin subunit